MMKCLRFGVTWVCVLVFTSGLFAQTAPVNDSCQNSITVMLDEVVNFSTIGATTDGPNHPDDCVSSGDAPDSLGADVWYTFTAPNNSFVRWSICGTADFDTKIAVYAPGTACPVTNDDLLACNEDANDDSGTACLNSTSIASWEAVAGETYLLRLGGWISPDSASSGTGTFFIEEFVPPPTPDNDDCADAIAIALGADQPISNSFATTDGPTHPDDQVCFGFNDDTAQNDIWYTFTSPITGTVEWSTCGTVNWDSRLVVYGPNVSCADASPDNMIGCSDATSGCPGFTNIVFFEVEQDTTYLLRVGGYGGATGTGVFSLLQANPPEPPGNDACTAADSVWIITQEQADNFDIIFEGTTIAASGSEGVVDPLCGTGQGGDFPDIWYKFNSMGSPEIEVRFSTMTEGAEFYGELYETCDGMIDMAVDTFCFLYDNEFAGLLVDTITGLPEEPKDYLFRVSSWIFEPPGEFFFQLVADVIIDVDELEFPGETKLFPNPATSEVNLNLDLKASAEVEVEWRNLLGQTIHSNDLGKLGRGVHSQAYDVKAWPTGVYFMVIRANNTLKTMRFVKS
jgi:hypothetical protein